MKSLLASHLPLFVSVTGSICLHLAAFWWTAGPTETVHPPPAKRGPASISLQLTVRRPAAPSPPIPSPPRPAREVEPLTPTPTAQPSLPKQPIAARPQPRVLASKASSADRNVFQTIQRPPSQRSPARPSPRRPQPRRPARKPAKMQPGRTSAARANDGAVSPPTLISNPSPRYPADARRKRIEGTVTMRFVIGIDGRARKARIVKGSGNAALDRASLQSLRGWQFRPATQNGKPIPHSAEHTFRWRLQK